MNFGKQQVKKVGSRWERAVSVSSLCAPDTPEIAMQHSNNKDNVTGSSRKEFK